MDNRPVIGISTQLLDAAWGRWDRQRAVLLPERYPAMVRAAGGVAVLLPPDAPQYAAQAVERLDALVVAGGEDVDPALYGARPHPLTVANAPERDAWEAALLRAALAAGKPVLGVCRGMQLLNVVFGGTLVQHLPDVVGHEGHVGPPNAYGRHPVRPVPDTLLGGLLPEPELVVPTFHHQAVDRLGEGLTVAAYAADGTVEAIEAPAGFVLGVQWHPEQDPADLRLAEALVRAASLVRETALITAAG
ncbi:gamma-glutamyl-gamma-aminobutyrate hydrolase family protein [Kitasatospora terrestris]|uniref:Gamma-glutamyl-gamma-aminobutyrate hydrolase family protein n=1 Tax=Kitasatospora terrestris TaxID=258051 RepID=A0ABP9EAV5_9ACTN